MNIIEIQTISITIYKLSSLLAGLALSFMGYKLFMAGVWGNAGDAEGSLGDNKLTLKRAAPGTFFLIVGAVVIGVSLVRGLEFSGSDEKRCVSNEKPILSD